MWCFEVGFCSTWFLLLWLYLVGLWFVILVAFVDCGLRLDVVVR